MKRRTNLTILNQKKFTTLIIVMQEKPVNTAERVINHMKNLMKSEKIPIIERPQTMTVSQKNLINGKTIINMDIMKIKKKEM